MAGLLALPMLAQAEDLLAVYQLAKINDPQFLSEQARQLADSEKLSQARALLLPELSAHGAGYKRTDELTTQTGGIETTEEADYKTREYSLSLKQPVFNAESFAAYSQARSIERKAMAGLRAAQQSLLLRTAEVYFGLLLAADNQTLAEAERSAVKLQLDLAQGKLDVGSGTITQVHEARSRFQLADAQVIEAENNLDDARQRLTQLTAQTMESVRPLGKDMPLIKPDPEDITAWTRDALEHNPALIAAVEEAEIASDEIHRQRAGHYPTLDIVGKKTRSQADGGIGLLDSETDRDDTRIGLELNVPLFRGGLVYALTAEAQQRYEAARQQHLLTRAEVQRQTRAAYLGVTSGARRVSALQQAVLAGESALEAKDIGFRAGINTNQDVLDAQRDLFVAKRDLASARYTYILNLLRLKDAAGRLGEQDLTQINGWLSD